MALARTRIPARLALVGAASALALAACGTGQNWVDEGLIPSGNGQSIDVGTIQAQNLTLVAGPEGSKTATLVATLINGGEKPDELASASVGAVTGTIVGGPITIEPFAPQATSIGYRSPRAVDFSGLDATVATYVPLTLTFRDAGKATVSVLVVPPTGYYQGIAPRPAPTTSPTASPRPSPSA